jgi:DNA-binding transcriptional MerR regulator
MAYTVKQLARLSGVSVRTLHFYDEIGLLVRTVTGTIRRKNCCSFNRFFYRELEFELKDIQQILPSGRFNKLKALKEHRELLFEKQARTGHRRGDQAIRGARAAGSLLKRFVGLVAAGTFGTPAFPAV